MDKLLETSRIARRVKIIRYLSYIHTKGLVITTSIYENVIIKIANSIL
ncbi:MAG: hypothetical protein ACJ0PV_01460 [Flavobacteriaceae bacterium]